MQSPVHCPSSPFFRQGGTCGQSKGPNGLLGVLPRSKWLPNGPGIKPLNLAEQGCEQERGRLMCNYISILVQLCQDHISILHSDHNMYAQTRVYIYIHTGR